MATTGADKKREVLHYPSLKTVLAVEDLLRTAEMPLKRAEIKKRLEKKVMHQTLNVILEYLVQSKKIVDAHQGVSWIFDEDKK